ncbi:MAG: rhodanese-like domain-containing protein [Chloroflexota bacterium]
MRKTRFIFALSILVFAISACNAIALTAKPSTQTPTVISTSTQTQPTPIATQTQPPVKIPQTADEVVRVSLSEAKRGFDNKSAIFVDTRPKYAYDTSHIKGALYLGDFELSPLSLDKHQWIITYCT